MSVAAPTLAVPVQLTQQQIDERHREAASRVDDMVCPIAMEVMTDPWSLICGHTFEKASLVRMLEIGRGSSKCSLCKTAFKTGEMVANHALKNAIPATGKEFLRLETLIEANRVQAELTLKAAEERRQADRQADRQEFLALLADKPSAPVSHDPQLIERVASLEQQIEAIKRLAEERRIQEEKNRKDSALHGLAYLGAGEAMGLVIFGAAGIACPPALPACLGIGAAIGGGAGVVVGLEEGIKKYAIRRDEINQQFSELRVQNASQN